MRSRSSLVVLGLALVVAFTWASEGWSAVNYNLPNYANSPPVRKFVNQLPTLTVTNNLGQKLPLAVPDTTTYPGSDYYEIGLKDYFQRMHTDLPAATKLRGYYQKNVTTPVQQYLGPVILATRNRAVRIKFFNELGTGAAGDLFLPVDTTVMGAGMGPLGAGGGNYPQNRATLHLHGGNPPWISDGTTHQWITPAGEPSPYKRGLDQVNVPDMPAGDGEATFYWPNQQSGRFMFYHDHAYGITRLNVYAGEAAGYLVVDPAEETALKAAGVPGTVITNPDTGAVVSADLKHLIPLVIQDKTFVSSTTTVTDPLWDTAKWGGPGSLWFPHVYMPTELMDGSGMNPLGRWDYGPWAWPTIIPAQPLPDLSHVPEAMHDTMVVNGTCYPYLNVQPQAYRFRILNASNDRFINLQLYLSDPLRPKEVKMVPADGTLYLNMNRPPAPYINYVGEFEPAYLPVPRDGRDGGVPDPTLAGPPMIQIGSEGGLLPDPVVLPNTAVDYDRDTRSFTFGNMRNFPLPPDYPRLGYTLLLGPAERADVIVDFSQLAGKTLILYNDAPAPAPWYDPRYDIFTLGPDYTDVGGPPTTRINMGPNTRTIMQIRVANTTPAAPFNLAALKTALPAIFAASQPPPIVPEGMFGNNQLWNVPNFAGYPVRLKSISEDFDPTYARIMGRLGTERLSFIQGQETFGKWFVEPPTENIGENKTQIWFVIHNGIDNHPIHFHLFNMQLVNRVDWAGVIKPPDPNERGWKETIRMNSYDSVVLAVRPKDTMPTNLPFQVPTSVRPLNVTEPPTGVLGSAYDKATNTNPYWNFDWQYVWHCHILSHEEYDMMRPVVVYTPPFAPTNANAAAAPGGVNVTWTDQSKNETGFTVQRATNAQFTVGLTNFTAPPNNGPMANPGGVGMTVTFTDATAAGGTTYYYRVKSFSPGLGSKWVKAPNPVTP